jgi:hypothetical protein
MDLREIGWGGMEWIDVAHDRDQWRALEKRIMGNSPRYPLDWRLGGPQRQSERYGEERNPCPCRESNPDTSVVQPLGYTD